MSVFTPGPWGMDINDPSEWQIYKDNGTALLQRIAYLNGTSYWGDVELSEDQANAHLIAAAPELYEALEKVLDFLEAGEPVDTVSIHTILAKARGET